MESVAQFQRQWDCAVNMEGIRRKIFENKRDDVRLNRHLSAYLVAYGITNTFSSWCPQS